MTKKRAEHASARKAEAPSRVPAWWDTLTFTHGPETEWFARSVLPEACRAGKTIAWRCAYTRRSPEVLARLLTSAGFWLVLEHHDFPRTPRGSEELHRVYVRAQGDAVAIVHAEGTTVRYSIASTDRAITDCLAEPPSRIRPRRART